MEIQNYFERIAYTLFKVDDDERILNVQFVTEHAEHAELIVSYEISDMYH